MAKIGLGENNPIQIELNRENFNALIGRHSQPMRWLIGEPCPCVTGNQKADENCSLCRGNGTNYTQPEQADRLVDLKPKLDGVFQQTGIISVTGVDGTDYPITGEDNGFTYVPGTTKGYSYNVLYTDTLRKDSTGTAELIDQQLYRVDLPVPIKFGTVQGDLVDVKAFNEGNELTVVSVFRNSFEIEETLGENDIVEITYSYINPFDFVLLHNNFSKSDQRFLDDLQGDGIMIFPQRYHVHQEDILVALNAQNIKKTVYASTGNVDTVPSFYPHELKAAYALRDNKRHTFHPGTDFLIYRGNSIKWVSANKPEINEQISLTYSFNTVYRVIADIPDPRTSENNRFPRKVAIKFLTDYSRREVI